MKLIIENCVMEGWHPDGYPGNLAYSPELWEWMFSIGLYLNFDPSHLVWMGIDPVGAVGPTSTTSRTPRPRTSSSTRRRATGSAGRARPSNATTRGTSAGGATGCPGLGEVDWRRLIDALYEGGFDGVLSVEHEDPVWGGTEEKVEVGLGSPTTRCAR